MGNGNKDSSGMLMHRIRSRRLIRFFVIAFIFLIFLSAFCITEQKQAEKGSEKAQGEVKETTHATENKVTKTGEEITESATEEQGLEKPAGEEITDMLITASWLKEHINDENIKIIAVLDRKETYLDAHIPNSIFVDHEKDLVDESSNVPYMIAPKEKIEELFRNLGIEKNDTIVVYDNRNNMIAARAYLIFKYYGHEDVKLLNGGLTAWQDAGGELTKEIPDFEKSNYKIDESEIRHSYVVDKEFVLKSLNDSNVILIDARPKEQYTGEKVLSGIGRGGGHIPGAINIPGSITMQGAYIKPISELSKIYKSYGVTKDKKVITYCHNGMLGSYTWFILHELLDYDDVSLYDGSMLEWSNDQSLPLVKGESRWGNYLAAEKEKTQEEAEWETATPEQVVHYFNPTPKYVLTDEELSQGVTLKLYENEVAKIGDKAYISFEYDAGGCIGYQTWIINVFRITDKGGEYEASWQYFEGRGSTPEDINAVIHEKTDVLDDYNFKLIKLEPRDITIEISK